MKGIPALAWVQLTAFFSSQPFVIWTIIIQFESLLLLEIPNKLKKIYVCQHSYK